MPRVVELRTLVPGTGVRGLARFVLEAEGPVKVVPLVPGGEAVWMQQGWGERIPGPDGRWLTPEDGELFLVYLGQNFRGSHLWATPVQDVPASPRPRLGDAGMEM